MKNYRYLMYSVVLTIVGFGLWIALDDHEQILQAISLIGWPGFLFICLLSLINYGLRYVRWHFLLKALGDKAPTVDGLICYLWGFALTTTPGKAGEAVRCLYFKSRHGISHAHTLAAILSERTSDAIAGALLALAAFYSFEQYQWIGLVFSFALIAVIFLVNKPVWLINISQLFGFIKISLVQKILTVLPLFLERSATLFSLKPLGVGTLLALISWSAEAIGFAWLSQTLGGEASFTLYMSIFAIGMIAGAISFLPGGLGGAEVVMYLLLKSTGMGDAEALTTTLICRLATLWFAVILGLFSVLWLEHRPYSGATDNSSSNV